MITLRKEFWSSEIESPELQVSPPAVVTVERLVTSGWGSWDCILPVLAEGCRQVQAETCYHAAASSAWPGCGKSVGLKYADVTKGFVAVCYPREVGAQFKNTNRKARNRTGFGSAKMGTGKSRANLVSACVFRVLLKQLLGSRLIQVFLLN